MNLEENLTVVKAIDAVILDLVEEDDATTTQWWRWWSGFGQRTL